MSQRARYTGKLNIAVSDKELTPLSKFPGTAVYEMGDYAFGSWVFRLDIGSQVFGEFIDDPGPNDLVKEDYEFRVDLANLVFE